MSADQMTSLERAQAFSLWHGGRWDAGDEIRLAEEMDAYAAESVRMVLEAADEKLRMMQGDERAKADREHRRHRYDEESVYEHAGNVIQRLRETIRAMIPSAPDDKEATK